MAASCSMTCSESRVVPQRVRENVYAKDRERNSCSMTCEGSESRAVPQRVREDSYEREKKKRERAAA